MRTLLASLFLLSSVAPVIAEPPPTADGAIAIAIVYNGQEIWIGNTGFETDPNITYPGALAGLHEAWNSLSWLPDDAELAVVSYSQGADVRVPMGPVPRANPFGDQIAYKYKLGNDLVIGAYKGFAELERSTAPNKHLIIISDGTDTSNETAPRALADLRRLADAANVGVHAIIYKGALSAEDSPVRVLDPGAATASYAVDIAPLLSLYFRLHGTRPRIDVVTPAVVDAPDDDWLRWWLQIGVGVALVGALALLTRSAVRR